MKPIHMILMFILGLGVIGLGLHFVSEKTATCNGETMGPGDRCITISHGHSVTRTADEQLKQDHTEGYVAVGVGGLMAVVSLGLLASERRRRPAAAAYGAPGARQPAAQPYGGPTPYPAAAPPPHAAYPPPGNPAQPPYPPYPPGPPPQGGGYPGGPYYPPGGQPPYPGH